MNDYKSVLYIRDKNKDEYRVVVNAVSDWDGFDKLIKYLEVNHQANIIEVYDGPDARRWILSIKGEEIELIHNDGYGNYFIAADVKGEALINRIGEDLEKRLEES